jgi:phage major head subunit gpT-like protein
MLKLVFGLLIAAVAILGAEPSMDAFIAAPFFFGPIVNRSSLTDTMRGFKTVFMRAYESASTYSGDLAMRVDSTSRQEEYRWLGAFPGLTEWLGDRAVKDLAQEAFVLKNKDFEATVAVSRNDIEDDNLGVYAPLFSQLGVNARQHPDELIFAALADGFSKTCFDSQFYFDVDHPNGLQASWSNKATTVLSAAEYETARQTMMSYLNEEGRPMRVTPTHLIVPPQLEKTALDIVRADLTTGGVSNVWRHSADVIVAPELAATPTYWFLADLKKPIKPFILQMRKEPEFVALDNASDEGAFMRKEYVYGVDYRGAVGYGLPHLIFGSTGGA